MGNIQIFGMLHAASMMTAVARATAMAARILAGLDLQQWRTKVVATVRSSVTR
jgi:hypothetical protein